MKLLNLFIGLTALALMSFVEKNGAYEPIKTGLKYQEAYIINTGDSSDACAWLIDIDGKYFKPKNLSHAFKQDSLHVKIDYEFSMTIYKCDSLDEGTQEVYLNWIDRVK